MSWISKNKKFLRELRSLFSNAKIKNTSWSRKKKALLVSLVLVCTFLITAQVVCAVDVPPSDSSGLMDWLADNTIGKILEQVQGLMIFLVSIATTLFAAVVDPGNISGKGGLLNQKVVQDIWIMVRDTLNMFFILILLFSAFCTIFQVEKWNLKKIWLNILINALLVNFSYPIARFFIDISNVAMYYFINNMFGTTSSGSNIFSRFGTVSDVTKILTPKDFASQPISYELMMIIFTFILGITLLSIAILFLVRLIALTVLVMFSPIGFVGYIFPATSSWADKWWKELFSYAFFGPIMIFILSVALNIADAMRTNENSFAMAAGNNAGPDQIAFIKSAALFTVPIVILWMGMGVAKGMGIAGAETVVGKAQGFAKSVGKWASGAKFAQDTFKAYRARREQAKGDKLSNRLGNWAGNKQDQLRGMVPIPGYAKDHAQQRFQSAESAKVAEEAKLRDTEHKTEGELQDLAQSGDKFVKAAALLELAARGKTNGTKELDNLRGSGFDESTQVFKQMQDKVKAYNPAAAFAHISNNSQRQKAIEEYCGSNKFDSKKLSAEALDNPEFIEVAMKTGALKSKDLTELADKSDKHKENIKTSITTLASDPAHQNTIGVNNEANRQIHLSHVAATGEIHSSLGVNERKEIIKLFNKDNTKNLTESTIRTHATEIAEHVNAGKFNEIGSNLKTDDSRRALVDAVRNAVPPRTDLLKQIKRSPILAGYL